MRRKPFRVAVVGIDGSGKSTMAKMLKKEYGSEAGYFRMRGYPQAGKTGKFTAKVLDRIGSSKSKSNVPSYFWKSGYFFSFPFFKVAAEKGKSLMIYDRYPRIDLSLMKSIHAKSKKAKIMYPFFEKFSGTAYPNVVVVTRRNPEIAMKEIQKRGNRDRYETLENLKRMDKALEEEIKKLKKKGVKVIELDIDALMKEEKEGKKTRKEVAELVKKKIEKIREEAN